MTSKLALGGLAALAASSALAFDFVKGGVSQVTFEGADRPATQLAEKEYGRIVEKGPVSVIAA